MDNTAPPPAAAAPAAPAAAALGTGAPASASPTGGGTPGTQGGTPTFATDKERADHYEARHREATDTLRKEGETRKQYETRLNRYKETYGDLEPEPTKPPAAGGDALPPNVWTVEKQKEWELDQHIGRTPSLVPHAQEVKDLVKGGLQLQEAKEIVAKRKNITLGPTVGPIDMMPMSPAGGGNSQPQTGFSNEQLEAMRSEGIDPEKAKKHASAVASIMKRANRK